MRGFAQRWQALGVLSVFLTALASPGLATSGEGIARTFDVGAGGRLIVNTSRGTIEVRGTDAEQVRVEIVRGSDSAEEILKDLDVDFSHQGDDVRIEAKNRRRWRFWDWESRNLRFLIDVPQEFDVELDTSGGSISVTDLRGSVRTKTSGGSLVFDTIEGPVWGRTSGGSISLNTTSGDAELRTSGGSINIGEVEGSVQANTSGGSIRIDKASGEVFARTSGGGIRVNEVLGAVNASTSGGSVSAHISRQPEADCRLTTSGGNVVVYLADDVAVDLDAHSSGGRVRSEFSVAGTQEGGSQGTRQLKGSLNGGGPLLYLRTSGGGIAVRKR